MRTVDIYGLTDPRSDRVRYVGWAYNAKERLRGHLSKLRLENTHKARWLRVLLSEGIRPGLIVLEQTTPEARGDRERYWIAHFRQLGIPLTNSSDGGPGCPGFKHTPDQIARQAAKIRGRPKSKEHRERLAASHRGLRPSLETRKKMALSQMGRKQSPESIAKTTAAHRGSIRTAEARERMRIARAAFRARKRTAILLLGEKTCTKCGQSKVLSAFYSENRMACGFMSACKSCRLIAEYLRRTTGAKGGA